MMNEITRQDVIKYMDDIVDGMGSSDPDGYVYTIHKKASEYIRQVPKYRKKAKRWKRKYMSLRSEMEKIRSEIAEDMANAEKEAKQTQDDISFGKGFGLQMALNTISKHLIIDPQE